jgi:hypothetical protein
MAVRKAWLMMTLAVLALVPAVCAARAQGIGGLRVEMSFADRSIAAGRFDDAESALFDESARAPRAPLPRGALGAFLAARGKLLVGATLLEEAMFFGGDSMSISTRLFEVYRWEGLQARAAIHKHGRVSPGLRSAMERVPASKPGGSALASVALQPNETFGLGRITLGVGNEKVEADIQPLMNGVQLPSSMALYSVLDAVTSSGDTTFAVAQQLSIGGVTIGPVPVMLVPNLGAARLGLDILSLLRPTFDLNGRTLTVRSVEAQTAPPLEKRELFLTFPGISFVVQPGQPPVTLHSVAGRAALRGLRWTLDVPAGAIFIER